jgi:hypothetical protein
MSVTSTNKTLPLCHCHNNPPPFYFQACIFHQPGSQPNPLLPAQSTGLAALSTTTGLTRSPLNCPHSLLNRRRARSLPLPDSQPTAAGLAGLTAQSTAHSPINGSQPNQRPGSQPNQRPGSHIPPARLTAQSTAHSPLNRRARSPVHLRLTKQYTIHHRPHSPLNYQACKVHHQARSPLNWPLGDENDTSLENSNNIIDPSCGSPWEPGGIGRLYGNNNNKDYIAAATTTITTTWPLPRQQQQRHDRRGDKRPVQYPNTLTYRDNYTDWA